MKPRLPFVALTVAVWLVPEAAPAQCALCRDAVAALGPQAREAMNYAIIGLALSPYAIAFAAAWLLSPAFRGWIRGRFGSSDPVKADNPS